MSEREKAENTKKMLLEEVGMLWQAVHYLEDRLGVKPWERQYLADREWRERRACRGNSHCCYRGTL